MILLNIKIVMSLGILKNNFYFQSKTAGSYKRNTIEVFTINELIKKSTVVKHFKKQFNMSSAHVHILVDSYNQVDIFLGY